MLNRAATSGIFSLYLVLSALFALINGWLFDRYGSRVVFSCMAFCTGIGLIITSQSNNTYQVFIGYSIFFAAGSGGTIPLITALISKWFEKNRGLALGIATSGSGLGSLIMPPIAGYLIDSLGWRYALVIMSIAIVSIIVPCTMLLFKKQQVPEPYSNPVAAMTGSSALLRLMRNRVFYALMLLWALYAIGNFTFITHSVPHATDLGIDLVQASSILSVAGIGSILVRLIAGKIADLVTYSLPLVIYALAGAIALLILIWSDSLWMHYLAACGYGVCNGGFGVSILGLAAKKIKSFHIGIAMGTMETAFTLGAALGSFVGGWLFDIFGSYTVPFIIGCLSLLFTIPLVYIVNSDKADFITA